MQQEHVAEHAAEPFKAGEVIIEHVSNSSLEHPLIHLPTVLGVDLSVTKHVLMLWLVAAVVFVVVMTAVRRYLRQDRLVPSGLMNALELVVEFIRDTIVLPNVGPKWVRVWTPMLVTLFLFILTANAIGLIPVFTTQGRGSDVMQPMAIPSVGGMALQLITLFIAPCLYCLAMERRLGRSVASR